MLRPRQTEMNIAKSGQTEPEGSRARGDRARRDDSEPESGRDVAPYTKRTTTEKKKNKPIPPPPPHPPPPPPPPPRDASRASTADANVTPSCTISVAV